MTIGLMQGLQGRSARQRLIREEQKEGTSPRVRASPWKGAIRLIRRCPLAIHDQQSLPTTQPSQRLSYKYYILSTPGNQEKSAFFPVATDRRGRRNERGRSDPTTAVFRRSRGVPTSLYSLAGPLWGCRDGVVGGASRSCLRRRCAVEKERFVLKPAAPSADTPNANTHIAPALSRFRLAHLFVSQRGPLSPDAPEMAVDFGNIDVHTGAASLRESVLLKHVNPLRLCPVAVA